MNKRRIFGAIAAIAITVPTVYLVGYASCMSDVLDKYAEHLPDKKLALKPFRGVVATMWAKGHKAEKES